VERKGELRANQKHEGRKRTNHSGKCKKSRLAVGSITQRGRDGEFARGVKPLGIA
jgi:hypothetical protein